MGGSGAAFAQRAGGAQWKNDSDESQGKEHEQLSSEVEILQNQYL